MTQSGAAHVYEPRAGHGLRPSLAGPMNATSATVASDSDEFGVAGLTAAPSRVIGAPRVAESPVNFECRVTQIMQLADATGNNLPT